MKEIKAFCLVLIAGASIALLNTGCVSAISSVGQNKAIVSVTTTVLGLRLAQNNAQQTPEMDFGYSRQTVVLMPANTNGPIYSPNYANTFNFDQTKAFSMGLGESVASGNYQTDQPGDGNTNTVTSQPIIPK